MISIADSSDKTCQKGPVRVKGAYYISSYSDGMTIAIRGSIMYK